MAGIPSNARRRIGRSLFVLVCMAVGGVLVGAYDFVLRHRSETAALTGAYSRKAALEELVRNQPTAANFVRLAETGVATEEYETARIAYASAAAVYRRRGQISFAYAAERLSQRYEVQAVPYVHEAADPTAAQAFDTHARLEPAYGCYLGAFIDHEDSIQGTYRDEYGTWRRDASAFNHLTDTHHAIFFMYLGYGRQFPAAFVNHMNASDAAAQIAWEPGDLDAVRDDAYLRGFARTARDSGTPIFLRFASEMNGDWVPYHGDPEKYIEKFRLVARVMHEEAPNVAMVWCPFETPVSTMDSYYPGPEAVDWVGLNVYSVPYWNNDAKRPAAWRNPADALRYVYGRYAGRHPIMICEYAASHRSSLDGMDRSEMARTKMAELYTALPRVYPRVKAVCWLSMNAIKHAIPGRQSNDYSLLGDDSVRARYAQLLQLEPHFLRSVPLKERAMAREWPVALRDGLVLRGRKALTAWVKLYDDHPTVVWKVNGETRYQSSQPGPHRWVLDTRKMAIGPAEVELLVFDDASRLVADVKHEVVVSR